MHGTLQTLFCIVCDALQRIREEWNACQRDRPYCLINLQNKSVKKAWSTSKRHFEAKRSKDRQRIQIITIIPPKSNLSIILSAR
jgi:hypothetical protein